MGVLTIILTILLVVSCAAMIGLVLIQRGRGSGLVAFGGSGMEQAFGTHAATLAQKATAVLAILFLVLSVALGLTYNRGDRETGITELPGSGEVESAPAETGTPADTGAETGAPEEPAQ